MPWLSRRTFTTTDKLHADDLNNLANDDRVWGGDVDGGGYVLSNVTVIPAAGKAAGAGVVSFNTRTGAVLPLAADYPPAFIGAVPIARAVNTGNVATTGLLGGGPLSTDLNLSAAVVSVFGRIGVISLTAPDITKAGGVIQTQQVKTVTGSGLQGGGPLNATTDLSLSVVPDSSNQQIQVMSQGSPVGSPRHAINFVSGTGALVTVQEISASNRIDVTVQSTGAGGGFVDPTQVTGDLIVRGLTAPATRLAVGTDGQVLTADHLAAGGLGVKWAAPAATNAVTSVFSRVGAIVASAADGYTAAMIANAVDKTASYNNPPWIASLPWNVIVNPPAFMLDPTQAKGDMIVHGQAGTTRLIPGSDGSILTADSTLPAGVRWGAVPMTSFNTRGGAVMPGGQDYTVDMIAGAVPTSRVINTTNTSGLSGGGPLSGNLSLAVVPDTTNQQVAVWQEGTTLIGTRKALNFKSGAGVALTIVDSPPVTGSNRIDITIASSGTGSGGGLVDPTTAKGDLIVRGQNAPPQALAVGPNGRVLTADDTQGLGMRWAVPAAGGAGSQSPWIGPVDAAGNPLNNASGIGVNIASDITKSRVYAFVNALEDGFRAVNNSAAGLAAASFINDAGDTLTVRSYGTGFVGGLPGLATIEASNVLALFANASETMRLKAGRVLIGTTTDDNVNKLQVNGKVKSLTGGFVFPDNTIQTTAYTAASSPVTSVFTRTGAVLALAGDYTAAKVTNAVDSSTTYNDPGWINTLAWSKIVGLPTPPLLQDPTTGKGDMIARGTAGPATRLAASTTNNWVLTADSAQPLGVKWAAPPAQSPWLTDIDGASHNLINVANIGIGNPFSISPFAATGYNQLVLGPVTASSNCGILTACSNSATAGTMVGSIGAANYAISAAEKRVASIDFVTEGTIDSGQLRFITWNAGARGQRMTIATNGFVGIGTTSPGCIFDVDAGPSASSIRMSGSGSGTFSVTCTVQNTNASAVVGAGILRVGSSNATAGNALIACVSSTATPFAVYADGLAQVTGRIAISNPPFPALNISGAVSDLAINLQNTGTGGHNWRIDSCSGASGYGQGVLAIVDEGNGSRLTIDTTGGVNIAQGIRCGTNGYIAAAGDLGVSRNSAPNQGAVYFGNGGHDIYFDAAQYHISAQTFVHGRLGVGIGPTCRVHLYGQGQDNSTPYFWPGQHADATLYLQDTSGTVGSGGAVMFGSPFGSDGGQFAAIKGYIVDGAGPQGHIVYYFRPTATDSAFFERMRFYPNGDINITGAYKVNGVAIGAGLNVAINGGAVYGNVAGIDFMAGAQMLISTGGGPAGYSRVVFTANVSDFQLKRNVQPLIVGGLPLIERLRPITAEWNGLANTREGERVTSVIAQDLRAVMPDAVKPFRAKLRTEDSEDTELLSVDSMAITAHLILAIQQLEQRLKSLEQKVN